ncbi:hypothetical protein HELRODRAFT_85545, partial [Helobdella robusta]|uniref:Uncharacterized protein n=1 Tax=Helobdella robusta TaxID=6412 RepID=T1G5Y8_HELRO
YMIGHHVLTPADSFKNLGVIIDNQLNFNQHINDITHRASTRARLIIKCFTSKDKDLLTKAYCTYVRSLLEYCSPI